MDPEMQALREQSAALARQGAAFRRALNGISFTWQDRTYCGTFSALRTSQEQDDQGGGFSLSASCTLRVDRATADGFRPAKGDLITRSDTAATLRIADIADNGIAPEIVLTLAEPHR